MLDIRHARLPKIEKRGLILVAPPRNRPNFLDAIATIWHRGRRQNSVDLGENLPAGRLLPLGCESLFLDREGALERTGNDSGEC